MTINNKGLAFNILGTQVKLSENETEDIKAKKAVELVEKEIVSLRKKNSKLKDNDIAVLVALSLATKNIDIEEDFKQSVRSFKVGITDALDFIEEVSPGSMQAKS